MPGPDAKRRARPKGTPPQGDALPKPARGVADHRAGTDRGSRRATDVTDHPGTGPVSTWGLTLGSLGVVFGDIGTSPLYAIDQIFFGHLAAPATRGNVLGGISLVIWAITIIVAIKYAIFVLDAQNDGEGGVFALYGLLHKSRKHGGGFLLWSLVLGAGLLLGDGMITPAISVLSAVEGLKVAAPRLTSAVMPVTIVLLTGLFAIQVKGTTGIGRVFGPVLLLWFVAIATLGAVQIAHHPEIAAAFDPRFGIAFLREAGLYRALLILGAVVLVITGGEAMYADLGHFQARPIRIAWFTVVYPALLLNYLGQGAYLLGGAPIVAGKLFYGLVPAAMLYPMIGLATIATVIASQALISGAFSMVAQAMRLGLFPRLAILHTNRTHAGQIYLPVINWLLYIGCIILVVSFRSSGALGAAYGLAVSGDMVITSLAMFPVARLYWGWSAGLAGPIWGSLIAVNGMFLLANSLKLLDGGFVPIAVGGLAFLVMATWRWGRRAIFAAYSAKSTMTMRELIRLHRSCAFLTERSVLLMTPKPIRHEGDRAPALLSLWWERHGVLPRNLIFVQVVHPMVPHIHGERCLVRTFERDTERGSIISVELSFGFMEEPDVEQALEEMVRHKEIDLSTDRRQWSVCVSQENVLPSRSMGPWQRLRFRLFMFLRFVSKPAYYYYGLGQDVQLSAEVVPVRLR